jgi:Cys-rich protein (TIGR01571 family)
MADTYSKSSADFSFPRAIIPGFWKALCVTLAMQFFMYHTGGLGFILFVMLAVFFRQKLRKTYGLPNCTGSVLAWDCLFWCCFPCCTIAQETRQVQFVTGQPDKIPSPLQSNVAMRGQMRSLGY